MAGIPSRQKNPTTKMGERSMMSIVGNILGWFVMTVFMMGWFDWAWIFGIESSRSYTWWYLLSIWGAG